MPEINLQESKMKYLGEEYDRCITEMNMNSSEPCILGKVEEFGDQLENMQDIDSEFKIKIHCSKGLVFLTSAPFIFH